MHTHCINDYVVIIIYHGAVFDLMLPGPTYAAGKIINLILAYISSHNYFIR